MVNRIHSVHGGGADVGVHDVALDELHPIANLVEITPESGREVVDDPDADFLVEETSSQVGSDEPGTAGDQHQTGLHY
jgi:hypothetical protein